MKKRIILIFTIILTVITSSFSVNAIEKNPQFLIAEDYVIIEYEKYDLVDNKIVYNGLEYSLIDGTLIAYDANNSPCLIVLPVEENMVKDEKKIKELNQSLGMNARGSIPSNSVPLPYSATVPKGGWTAESPFVRVNLPTYEFMPFTYVTITNMPFGAKKEFKFGFFYCDAVGNWYDTEYRTKDLSVLNYLKVQNYTTTSYAKFFITCLYGEPGFTYTITKSKI